MSKKHLVNWLIDDTYDDDIRGLISTLESRKTPYKLFTIKDYYQCFLPDPKWDMIPYAPEDKVFFLGCILMMQKIQRGTPWIPGALGDFKFVECINYYPILHKFLLNKDYAFTNVINLRENWAFYQSCFGEDIFVRPNSGKKIFSGCVIHDPQEIFDDNQSTLGNDLLPTELAVLSRAVNIESEYRFLTVNGEPITGSSYRVNGEMIRELAPEYLYPYVKDIAQVLKEYEIASIVDVAIVENKPYLLEINTVSCSGLYKMDMNKYIEGVEEACRIVIEQEEV